MLLKDVIFNIVHTLGGSGNTSSQRRQRLPQSLNHPLHQVRHFNEERSPEGTLIFSSFFCCTHIF